MYKPYTTDDLIVELQKYPGRIVLIEDQDQCLEGHVNMRVLPASSKLGPCVTLQQLVMHGNPVFFEYSEKE